MFEMNDKQIEITLAEKRLQRMMMKTMTAMMLESDMPETDKLNIRVLEKIEDIHEVALVEGIVLKYCNPNHKANMETLTKVLEYLELVEVGIRQFVDGTPFVADTEEDDEVC
jgi:hypothetical protein